jgi:hypothetical protein
MLTDKLVKGIFVAVVVSVLWKSAFFDSFA